MVVQPNEGSIPNELWHQSSCTHPKAPMHVHDTVHVRMYWIHHEIMKHFHAMQFRSACELHDFWYRAETVHWTRERRNFGNPPLHPTIQTYFWPNWNGINSLSSQLNCMLLFWIPTLSCRRSLRQL